NGTKLSVRNNTGTDVILCLFSKSAFVRSVYIPDSKSTLALELPENITLRYSSGFEFDVAKKSDISMAVGAFSNQQAFYKSIAMDASSAVKELVLLPGINANFMQINEKEFFKREEL